MFAPQRMNLFRSVVSATGRNLAVQRLYFLTHSVNLCCALLPLLLLPPLCLDKPFQMQSLTAQLVFRVLLLS